MTMEKLNKLLQEGKFEIVEEEMSDVCKKAVELIKYWMVELQGLKLDDYVIRVLMEAPDIQEYRYLVDTPRNLVGTPLNHGSVYYIYYNGNSKAWRVTCCTDNKYKLADC